MYEVSETAVSVGEPREDQDVPCSPVEDAQGVQQHDEGTGDERWLVSNQPDVVDLTGNEDNRAPGTSPTLMRVAATSNGHGHASAHHVQQIEETEAALQSAGVPGKRSRDEASEDEEAHDQVSCFRFTRAN